MAGPLCVFYSICTLITRVRVGIKIISGEITARSLIQQIIYQHFQIIPSTLVRQREGKNGAHKTFIDTQSCSYMLSRAFFPANVDNELYRAKKWHSIYRLQASLTSGKSIRDSHRTASKLRITARLLYKQKTRKNGLDFNIFTYKMLSTWLIPFDR